MKQILRSFAIGLLTATLIFGITFLLEDKNTRATESKELTIEELQQQLEEKGYYVSKEAEATESNQEKNTTTTEKDTEEDVQDSTPKEIRIYMLEITSGMTISEVADALETADIISDSAELITFLQENDYGTNIQIGDYEITSEMSLQNIAETIASKN